MNGTPHTGDVSVNPVNRIESTSLMRIRRRNLAWLTILGVLAALPLFTGASLPVIALVGGLFLVALAATLIEVRPADLLATTRSSLLTRHMSPDARAASERARRRAGRAAGFTLLDVGVITMQTGSQGVVMRKTRSASKDEDGVRPFATLHIDPQHGDRQIIVRYEMVDHNGDTQYIHEMKQFVREGEVNIVADHQLPLAGNTRLQGAGEWDVRVFVQGHLVGMHPFMLSPSYAERFPEQAARQATIDARARAARRSLEEDIDEQPSRRIRAGSDDAPQSLEDLLRSGGGRPDDDRPNDARSNDARNDRRTR